MTTFTDDQLFKLFYALLEAQGAKDVSGEATYNIVMPTKDGRELFLQLGESFIVSIFEKGNWANEEKILNITDCARTK